jgi:nucleobase:cation symporter-1, NCS1 family
MFLRRRQDPAEIEHLLFNRKYTNWAGPVAMAVGAGISIWLFSNQTKYVGLVPAHNGNFGDLTFEVGFVLTVVIYLAWRLIAGRPARTA